MPKHLQRLIEHVEKVPFSWNDDGKLIIHKNTTGTDILHWVKRLIQLNIQVKDEIEVLDVRIEKHLNV